MHQDVNSVITDQHWSGTAWERERDRRFILHNTTIQLRQLWRTKQSGGLPERHKAHRSWPPITRQ